MQIIGTPLFVSNTMTAGNAVRSALSALPIPMQKQPSGDSLLISDLGRKLSLHEKRPSSLTEARKADAAELPEWAQAIDRSLKKVVGVMKKMKDLTELAQDKTLTDLERIEIQIEIEDMRANLAVASRNMRGEVRSGEPSVDRLSSLSGGKVALLEGDEPYGDYSSVLERARDRILKGQEWDVREAWCNYGFSRMTQDENGEDIIEVFESKTWYVVDDSDVLTRGRNGYVSSGRKIPTVRERLDRNSSVVVMDADSAAMGTELLERQIAAVEGFRETLPEVIEREEGSMLGTLETACAFIDRFLLSKGYDVLTDPDVANYHLYDDGIYDEQTVMRQLVQPDVGGYDIDISVNKAPDSLFETGIFNVKNLSGIELENVIFPQPVKTVIVQGYSRYSQNVA